MDFDTGSSGSGGRVPPPGGGPGATAGAPGEFNLSDPVNSFVSTVRGVVLDPVNFFRGMQRRGDFVNPLLFALICALIYGILAGILNLLFPPEIPQELREQFGDAAPAQPGVGSLILSIILTPIYTAIGLFIGAGILHLLVMLLVQPSNAGYEATFRVAAYASALQLVNWLGAVPFIGFLITILVALYAVYIAVVGIREVHTTTTGRAAAVVLIPTAVVVVIFLIIAFVIAALFAAAL